MLGNGEVHKLLGITAHFKELASVFPNLLGEIYTCIYEATAHHKLGHLREAQVALKQALSLAAPDQLMLPFVENCSNIDVVLDGLSQDATVSEFIRRIKTLIKTLIKTVAPHIVNVQKALTGTAAAKAVMTAREREIAELAVSGLSNSLIGKQLYVSEATIKKDLQNIYIKLGINNRLALAKAILSLKSY